MSKHTPVGKTKDQGWEIGVRRTFPIDAEKAWEALITQPGLGLWLGDDPDFIPKKDTDFHTVTGVKGYIVSVKQGTLLRMRWQPQDWTEPSTLQLRLIPDGNKTTISIHHERLADVAQREKMHKHWSQALDEFGRLLENN